MKNKKVCFGLIVGNRGFFPDMLAKEGNVIIQKILRKLGYELVALSAESTKFGAVETYEDARMCVDLFRRHRDSIDGVIVTLPNFGDERGVADTLKMAGLDVPVLVHAWPDTPSRMTIAHRRDAFCGKISVCNNLTQYGIPFSLTQKHTLDPASDAFGDEIHNFAAICRVVSGMRNCRVGALGARPAAFNTVRYSEKLLQGTGITVETLDLSEALGEAEGMKTNAPLVKETIKKIKTYVPSKGIPATALAKMAKLQIVLQSWMERADLDITAIQCWTALEEYYGVVPCTVMSMMSDKLRSSACEVDVCGAVAMHALSLASNAPSFLLDWNNNYGEEDDKCVCFHCSNLPKSCFDSASMDFQEIIAGAVGKENTYGTVVGRIKAEPVTYARISTFDQEGLIGAYVGEGTFTNDTLQTFGGYGVVEIPRLQELLQFVCRNGFEHHVAANHSGTARALEEAFSTYLGWDCYRHS